ncbi:hypothetical protein MCELANE86_00490 [Candidatus Nanopelagicaceae bacterium]
MQDLPDYFDGLVQVLETYIAHKTDHFTLQTYGGEYINGPYVQALQEHDNVLLIEAISNEFLEPPLEEPGQQTMLFMGWRFYPERYLPNYAQFIDQSELSPREIAVLMARALHFAYGVDDTYSFEIAPHLDAAKSLIERLGIANG